MAKGQSPILSLAEEIAFMSPHKYQGISERQSIGGIAFHKDFRSEEKLLAFIAERSQWDVSLAWITKFRDWGFLPTGATLKLPSF